VSETPSVPELPPEDLRALQRGDVNALEAAWRLHGNSVHRTCRNMLGQSADADDAAQEVFLRVLRKARSFAGGARFSTWLYRLTVNHCLNVRRRPRLVLAEEPDALPGRGDAPDAAALAADARAELDRLLQRLSPEARTVLVLREIEELSYAEIAAVLGIPEGTVMSRLSRARARLLEMAPARTAEPELLRKIP
jgi:RNA polymerase sigma-70 factor (ECF subfamily)